MTIQPEIDAWVLKNWRSADEYAVRDTVTSLLGRSLDTIDLKSTLDRFLVHPRIGAILDRDPAAAEIAKAYLRHKFFAFLPDDAIAAVIQDIHINLKSALTGQLTATIRMGHQSKDELEGVLLELALWLFDSLKTARRAAEWSQPPEMEAEAPPDPPAALCDCSTGFWELNPPPAFPILEEEAPSQTNPADTEGGGDDDAQDIWWHPSISLMGLVRREGLGQWRVRTFWSSAFMSSPLGRLLRLNGLARAQYVAAFRIQCENEKCGHRHTFLTDLHCDCKECLTKPPVRYRTRWLLWSGIPGAEAKLEACRKCGRMRDGDTSPFCPNCQSPSAQNPWATYWVFHPGVAAPIGAPAPGAPEDAPGFDVADEEVEDIEGWIDGYRLTSEKLQRVRDFYLEELANARGAHAAVHLCSVLGSQTGSSCIADAIKATPILPDGWEQVFVERVISREPIPDVLTAIHRCVGGICTELRRPYPGALTNGNFRQKRHHLRNRLKANL